ncbi:MAG: general secretion pathway protein GspK [Geminicoccaceae bacterium]
MTGRAGSGRMSGGGDRGIALVAVLWITTLLALLAAGIGSSSRTEVRLAYNAVERAKAKALADGGVHEALFQLTTGVDDLSWEGGVAGYRSSGDDVRVLIRDEDGKLDVNRISPDIWRRLLLAIGLDEGAARVLADRIIDFRDPERRAPGTQNGDDAAAWLSGGAADGRFLATSELLDVAGMTGEIYRRLRPHVTVHAGVEGVDPARASRVSLNALPGMTPEAASIIATSPQGSKPLLALPYAVTVEIEPFLLPSRELIFSIESLATSGRGGRFARDAIVALDGGSRSLPVTVYAWRQGNFSSIEPITQAAGRQSVPGREKP